jgi:peptidase C13-like protein
MERVENTTAVEEAPAAPSFKRFLRAYAALLLGRTPAANDLTISSRLVLALPTLGFAMWLIVDRWRAGTGAEFFPYAMFAWSWYVVVLLASLWISNRLARPHAPYDRLLVITAAFAPVVLALELAQEQWVREDWVFVTSIAIAIYVAIYVSRALRSLTGRPQPRAAWMLAAILCAAVWLTQSMYFGGRFWYVNDESDEEGSQYWADMRRSEALMYAQPERIDAAVRALQRPAELRAAAFFVGFAGQGEQRVFAGEIALARKVVAAKFGSAQRSVLLVNDRRDLETLPLASPTALRYALDGIAARMKLDSDVLFLALSSHGSKDGEIVVSNGMLGLNDLSADDLATALRESRIKWKVIILSACYAGKFIEPLRDDNTIIIAAAAADRTSFGCSDDRDLTYFGEAFYRDALPTASDLQAAFRKASTDIAVRERTEGRTASNPQAHFGRALVAHLQAAFPGT